MHKSALFRFLITVMFVVTSLSVGCALRPGTDVGAAKPAYSFDNYTNSDFGFTVGYPKSWAVTAATAPYNIFRAESKQKLPSMSISVLDSDKVKEQVQEIYDYYKLTNIQTIEQKEYVLADGQTKALYTITRMTHPQVQLISYSIIFPRNGKLITVGISTMLGVEDTAYFNSIFQTLTFNK